VYSISLFPFLLASREQVRERRDQGAQRPSGGERGSQQEPTAHHAEHLAPVHSARPSHCGAVPSASSATAGGRSGSVGCCWYPQRSSFFFPFCPFHFSSDTFYYGLECTAAIHYCSQYPRIFHNAHQLRDEEVVGDEQSYRVDSGDCCVDSYFVSDASCVAALDLRSIIMKM
jgi:hypothetical protein